MLCIFLGLSFLICKVGMMTFPVSRSCCEARARRGVCRARPLNGACCGIAFLHLGLQNGVGGSRPRDLLVHAGMERLPESKWAHLVQMLLSLCLVVCDVDKSSLLCARRQ